MHPKIEKNQSFEQRLIFHKKYQYSFWIDFSNIFMAFFRLKLSIELFEHNIDICALKAKVLAKEKTSNI